MKSLNFLALLTVAAFLLVFPALALGQAATPTPAPAPAPASPLDQWDLGSYIGLSAAVVAMVGALKKLFSSWIEGKEQYLGLALSYVLGISAKLFIPGLYKEVNWVVFLMSLLVVAAGAKIGHDHFLNEIIKGKTEGDKK